MNEQRPAALRLISSACKRPSIVPDVIDIESGNLNNIKNAVRTAVAVDSLSDRYLRSLAIVGQVVAHNCDLSSKDCDCTTIEAASSMVRRCLPNVDATSEKWAEVASAMATQCARSKFEQRQAIASMVSSYAFAIRR